MLEATWDESDRSWIINLSTSQTLKASYVVTALGLLSKPIFPQIPGLDTFAGEVYHTATWPDHAKLQGKRVGIIGNGCSGVQLITALAKTDEVSQLLCFQRSPQYTIPAGNRPVTKAERAQINENYAQIWSTVNGSRLGLGLNETSRKTSSVTPSERDRIYEEAWQKGNNYRFTYETFGDITTDEEANRLACDFIKAKIRMIVRDPEKARKLCPRDLYARNPVSDSGFYEAFNNPKVDVVDIYSNPITSFTPTGIATADGTVYDLDVIICATGFDGVEGSYNQVVIKGRGGKTVKGHWAEKGPTSYLGLSVAGFPNLFMVAGPNSPFANQPPVLEAQVDAICKLIARAEGATVEYEYTPNGNGVIEFHSGIRIADPQTQEHGEPNRASKSVKWQGMIEATQEAEDAWTQHCDEVSADSLFRKVDSWIFGKNIPGKKEACVFYFGGLAAYRKKLRGVIKDGFRGWIVS